MKKLLLVLITSGLIMGSMPSMITAEGQPPIAKKIGTVSLHLAQTIGGLSLVAMGTLATVVLTRRLSHMKKYQSMIRSMNDAPSTEPAIKLDPLSTRTIRSLASTGLFGLSALITGGIITKMGITNLINDFRQRQASQ
jgi:hypothetical protein